LASSTKTLPSQLIYQPVKDYELDAATFLMQLTGKHPLFLQRVCDDIVEHKNSQPWSVRLVVTGDDVEAVLGVSLGNG
jgi:hypothetical protein